MTDSGGGGAGSRWALGLMSGTSLDGLDAALIRSDGRGRVVAGARLTRAYDAAFRGRLRSASVRSTLERGVLGPGHGQLADR